MNRRDIVALGCLGLLTLSACSAFGGGSTNEPPKGGSDRRYAKTPDEVSRAVGEALNELNISILSDNHDALGGEVKAKRANASEDPVTVWYQSADERNTQVSVGVGKGDRQIASLIQDQIAQKLGASTAKAAASIGARTEGQYDQPVAQCMSAAEQALKELKLEISQREVHDTWAQVEARKIDALPVIVRMNRNEKDRTVVSFTAGTSKSQDTEQIADRLKAEFERVLSSASAK